MTNKGWCRLPISDLADFCSGGTPDKGRPDYWNGPIPWVTAKDMKAMHLGGLNDGGKGGLDEGGNGGLNDGSYGGLNDGGAEDDE